MDPLTLEKQCSCGCLSVYLQTGNKGKGKFRLVREAGTEDQGF